MSVVKHNGSTNWYYSFQINKTKYFGSTGTSNKVLARRIEQAKRDGIVEKNTLGQQAISITFGDAFELYLNENKDLPSFKVLKAKQNVLNGVKFDKRTGKNVKVYGFDFNRNIHSFVSAEFEVFAMKRKQEGTTSSTIVSQLNTVRAIFNRMQKLGYLVNDCIDWPEINVKKTDIVCLTTEEEDLLLAEFDTSSPKMKDVRQDQHDFVSMLFDLGFRYQELAQIEWKNIDIKAETIFYTSFKSGKTQTAYMTNRVKKILARRNETKRANQMYVFENATKTSHKPYQQDWLKRAVKRSGITKNFTFHKARSTFASRLIRNNVSLMEISALLNHSSPNTTLIYAGLVPNTASKKAAMVLNSLR